MGTTVATPQPTTVKVVKKFTVYGSDLKPKTVEKELNFTPATDFATASERLGNDESKILRALNGQLRRDATNELKKSVAAEGGIAKKPLLKFVNLWRMSSPFSSIEDRKKQTDAILEAIRTDEARLAMLKLFAANFVDDSDDGDEEDSGE